MQPKARFHLIYFAFAILAVVMLHDAWVTVRSVEPIAYSEFQRLLAEKQVTEVVVTQDQIQGELKQAVNGKTRFVTSRVEPDLAKALGEHGIKFSQRHESGLLQALLSWVLPALVFVGIWILLLRWMSNRAGAGGGLMAIGKSKAKVFVETDTKTTFADVAGVEEAKHELAEIVAFLKDPKSYGRLGARMPKGVLLVGPPGTGKTLLARAVAGEASVPFFSISGSEFVEMFVGVGAARVRDLFEQARRKAPAIIFVDELDALGKARNTTAGIGGHDEKEQTLNQLLVELDGFDSASGIVLLGATNRPEILDPALLRAGRFDRQVLVDKPDKAGRIAILQVHSRKVLLDDDVSLEQVAALTPGFSGADLANLVNEAALAATRREASAIAMEDFNSAIERIIAGLEKRNRVLNPRERRIVAFHEMGHAIVAASIAGCDPVHKVSIIPRGIGALGFTIQRPTEDRYLMTRDELEAKMTVLLGGRAAEQVVFGHLSTGASDDLSRATDIARSMATRYAMVPKIGHATYDTEPAGFLGPSGAMHVRRAYSEETAREIDRAIREIVGRAFERARAILESNRKLLDESSEQLLTEETLDQKALAPYFERLDRSASAFGSFGRELPAAAS